MTEYRPDSEEPTETSLPIISEDVKKRFLDNPPDFESLYKRLKENDAHAADWLRSAVEKIAPARIVDKERYGKIALQLYGMFLEQITVDKDKRITAELEEQFANNPSSLNEGPGNNNETEPPLA